jgi:hypothetical protein
VISCGKQHLKVPKGKEDNLAFRKWLLGRAANNPRIRQGLVETCRQDILFYINAFVWQYNPQRDGDRTKSLGGLEVGPFITWPFQDEAFRVILECIQNRRDLCVEKSREMGATWMFLIACDWMFLFHSYKKFLCISRNADAVDCADPDSLFWKIDFMHEHLPDWLMPGGDPANIERTRFYYGNKHNSSTITGQASTGRAGVGGRATAMFVDEFTQIREDTEVLHRTSDTTGCRLFNFTHLGTDTAAFELTSKGLMRKLRLHWTQHPDKIHGLYQYSSQSKRIELLDTAYQHAPDYPFVMDGKIRSPWYDDQCQRKGSPRAVAMDLDIDPYGSVSQFADPMMIRELIATWSEEPYWEGDLYYDRDTGRLSPVPLMAQAGGLVKLWLVPDKDGRVPKDTYAGGVDTSEGMGNTPSCLSIVNRRGEKVLQYVNRNIKPEDFGILAVAMCRLFCDASGEGASLAWEMCGPGDRFGRSVINLGYRNVFYRQNEAAGPWARKPQDVPGWFPSQNNRTLLLGEYRRALYQRQFVNRSSWALEQFLEFRYDERGNVEFGGRKGDDYSGEGINHGDIVIADALAWKMISGSFLTPGSKEIAPEVKVGSLQWRRDIVSQRRRLQEAWS